MKFLATVLASVSLFSSFSMLAVAQTQGPGAKLYKLPDRWVSVLPKTEQEIAAAKASEEAALAAAEQARLAQEAADAAAAAAAAPVIAAPAPVVSNQNSGIPGYTPDPNYSGACHVTVQLDDKTYVINPSSSTDMVEATPSKAVCLPTERMAQRYGFKKTAR